MALPLAGDAVLPVISRPPLLAAVVVAALLFALAPRWQALSAIFGVCSHGAWLRRDACICSTDSGIAGEASWGYWLLVLATWLGAALTLTRLAALRTTDRTSRTLQDLAIPVLFGAFLVYLWEVAVRGFGVPPVLMPAPTSTAQRFAAFAAGAGRGFRADCVAQRARRLPDRLFGAGFVVAIIAYRFDFLKRGLLPLGNFVSALPIVGIAPIMVMWFGFDWPSKAAVVAVMCFFPMLVNTLAGLAVAGPIERDLMRSYAAPPAQTLLKLHLAGGAAVYFQRAEDQFDAGADRRHRRRVLRHPAAWHRLSHFHRSGPHVARYGMG